MRKFYLYIILGVLTLAGGCGMKSIRVKVLKPAPLSIDPAVKSIALIDRTIPEKKGLSIGEGILTGEGPNQDKGNIQNTLDGVVSIMGRSSRYHLKRTNLQLKSAGMGGQFPQALTWDEVAKICREHDTDAVLSLENYDSDFIVTEGDKVEEERIVEGDTIMVPVYYARGIASIKLGFRLYDLENKTIADQFHFENTSEWNAKGSSVHDAIRQLIDKDIATKRASHNAGIAYGKRITPQWTWVNRKYFKKPKNTAVARGARNAEVDNWDQAASIWEEALNHPEDKVAGRAIYNLALAREIMGNLQDAKKWAQEAYATYGIKKAKDYANTLDYRIREQNRLDYQMDH